ncbi:hypothetical protein A6K76_05380 [Caryophanon latum]|uniref:YncE family protein n=1 Tax=Caryophanon latum TaxID=33977 RepID=A0A1C0Z2A2_9BACL|nr:hypothetical protein A6K76_05380 [Caryophanon latum]
MRIGLLLAASTLLLASCGAETYTSIREDVSFVATVNQLEPSMTFFNDDLHAVATWAFDEAYSGATLVDNDTIALYGMGVPFVALYHVSTGELQTKLETGVGVTNVIAGDDELYVANKEQNTVSAFSFSGEQLRDVVVGNYPLSMAYADDTLYVLNFKSDYLSVIEAKTFHEVAQWQIPRSSNGIVVNEETNTLWIGGHGDHTSNDQVLVIDRKTGSIKQTLQAPQMPVALAQHDDEISVISHGSNTLHRFTKDGKAIDTLEIGANPFSVAYFNDAIVTAGYDDHTLYVVDGEQVRAYDTGEGPFQLVIRE